MKKSTQKGFTLLELLLVVGIAAILIVAGITTYNLVNKSNQINEATRLINTVLDQTRRLYAGVNTYGANGTNIEPPLINSGSVPARYRGAADITSPFANSAAAVTVLSSGNGQTFTLSMIVPPAYVPELAQNFNPATSSDVVSITACGGAAITAATAAANMTPTALDGMCADDTVLPAAGNFTIIAR